MRRHLALPIALVLATLVVVPLAGAQSQATAKAPTVTVLKGTFTNSAKYDGSGTARVTRRAGVRTLRLAKDFRADPNAIRLRMYLATDASGRTHVDLGAMAETGAQVFRIPKGVSLSTYRYAIAWCAAVNEPITQAKLLPVRR